MLHFCMNVQAAVPKFMSLKLDPASGTSLPPGAPPLTQTLHVTNSQHGVKPFMLRLRLNFTIDGKAILDQAEVKNLPAGL
jgi:AP-1 complex subunit gamma-1